MTLLLSVCLASVPAALGAAVFDVPYLPLWVLISLAGWDLMGGK